MRTMRVMVVTTILLFGLLLAPAQATPVNVGTFTLDGCASCYGSTYSLSISQDGSLYTALLSVNTTDYDGSGSYITAVDFKVASAVANISLLDAPNGKDDWSASQLGINSGGCSTPGSGFVCSQDTLLPSAAPTVDTTHTWVWTFELPEGVALDLTDVHIGAKYNNSAGTLKGQITSESVAVPEPSTLLLLGSGLLGLGGLAWRRNRKS